MSNQIRPAVMLFLVLTALTGLIYPLAVNAVAQWWFPDQANGSILKVNGRPSGSSLIGQAFSSPRYFWGRLSATVPYPYNAAASSGSNLGPLNPALQDAAKDRIAALRAAALGDSAPVPVDLVTASGSGLDPEISLAAAYYQAPRVAMARRLPVEQVRSLIDRHARRPWLGVLGEPRVNVLSLNLALDEAHPTVTR